MMPSTNAAVSVVLALLAFALQGCLLSNMAPSVKIAIGHQCDEKVSEISESESLKNIHAAKKCEDLDQAKLHKFKVDDCPKVLHDLWHFALGAQCEIKTAVTVKDDCGSVTPKCKSAIDAAVKGFEPKKEHGEPDAADDSSFEGLLGLVQWCEAALYDDHTRARARHWCEEGPDAGNMTVMNMDKSKCIKYASDQFTEIFTIVCTISAFLRGDAPKSADDATVEWTKKAAGDFAARVHSPSDLSSAGEALEGMMERQRRLRLFQVIRRGRWPGQLRAWSPAAAAAAAAASMAAALALAALRGAWRRLPRPELPQDSKPILGAAAQEGLQAAACAGSAA